MDTPTDLITLYDKIGDVISVQSSDPPYNAPIAVGLAKSAQRMESRKAGNRYPFEFRGDMQRYLAALGTDAKSISVWLQRDADGIPAIQSKGIYPQYVLGAEVEATRGGDIENGEWSAAVGNQLYQLVDCPRMAVFHGSDEKGYQWKE